MANNVDPYQTATNHFKKKWHKKLNLCPKIIKVFKFLGLYMYHTIHHTIATDKREYTHNTFMFLISRRKHMLFFCGYSLEVPRRGASNEYPQRVFIEK